MSRYKYIPMSYDDYMGKYINTLKTGELLVDLNNHDIYVTEEGFNIPIPTTKQLRDKIINYLENDLEGIKIRQQVIPGKINNLFSIKQAIEEQQQNIFDRTKNLLDDSRSLDRQYTFLNKVNENNVNQLGDLKVNLNNIKDLNYVTRINSLINEFNRINTNAQSGVYSNDATNKNTYLNSLWTEIIALMSEVNNKLNGLGSFSGKIVLKRNATRTIEAYDVTYTRRLYNFSNWTTINSASDLIYASQAIRPKFISWFKGNAYQDLSMANIMDYGIRGTGFFYKNFPNKVDLNSGNTYARRFMDWDLLEGIPAFDYWNNPADWSLGYMRSNTNNLLPDYWGQGRYATSSGWTKRYKFETASNDYSKFGYGADTWRKPFSIGGASETTTTDSLMNIITSVNDPYAMQRTPRSTKWNSIDGAVSNVMPIIPTITREIPYISTTNIRNNDGILVRMGIKKTLNETELAYSEYTFNNTNGWT